MGEKVAHRTIWITFPRVACFGAKIFLGERGGVAGEFGER